MLNDRVSAIIPAYNSGAYVSKAIESVLAQTCKNIEVVVVDDGSTDETQQVLAKYQGRIKSVRQINAGASAARNRGVRESSGKYVAFLDADDIWYENKLDEQMLYLSASGNIGLVFSDMAVSYNGQMSGKSWVERMEELEFSKHVGVINDAYCKLIRENCIPTSAVLVRRECFTKNGGFDETLAIGEDWNLWLKVAKQSDIVYTKRVHGLVTRDKDMARYDWETYFRCFVEVMEREQKEAAEDLLPIIRKNLSRYYYNLGYHYLREYRVPEAKKALMASLKNEFNVPAMKSIIRAMLGS